jgi:hypothetical protein
MNFLKQILKQNAMKKVFTLMIAAAIVFAGCSKDDDDDDVDVDNDNKTPPHAASTQTWTFGEQTWSDLIQMPDCNKETFEDSGTDPQCRSYTEGSNTWYYYNWAYVNANSAQLCPSPWHVPSVNDYRTLVNNMNGATLTAAWGLSGTAMSSAMYLVGQHSYYWSSTDYDINEAYIFAFNSGELTTFHADKYTGFPLRCVK